MKTKLLLIALLLASPLTLNAQTQSDSSAQGPKARYVHGECTYFNGVCYRPLNVVLDSFPAPTLKKPGESRVVWRRDSLTGVEKRLEFSPDQMSDMLKDFPLAGNLPGGADPALIDGTGRGPRDNNRTKITDTTQFPFGTVLHILMMVPGTQYGAMCTGMMFGAGDVALTAAHCCYNNDRNEGPVGALDIQSIIPGQSGQWNNPFGTTDSLQTYYADEWKNGGRDVFNYDWCVIKLKDNMGPRTGWMNIVDYNQPDSYYFQHQLVVLGYPGDLENGMYMYRSQGRVLDMRGYGANLMYHDAYIYQGNSGGPNFFELDGGYEIVGIVSHGISDGTGREYYGSVLIDEVIMTTAHEAMGCDDL